MALPASVPTGTVTGTWYTPSGALAVGTIVFLLLESVEVPDDPDGVVIPVRTVVDVPAGVLNQTLPEGVYQVSMRLSELYRVTKVVEITEGTALNLPDAVGMLLPDPDLYDPVRSVNGVFPDAYGNIEVSGGGGGSVASVFGRTGAVVAANGDYTKSQVGLSNVDNTSDLGKPISTATQTALDGKAATSHTHIISNVTGLQTALDGKQGSGDYATNTALTDGLATKANTIHTHVIGDVSGLTTNLDDLGDRVTALEDEPGTDTNFTAARYGCKALTADPHDISWTTPQYINMVDSRQYVFWLPLPVGTTLTGVRLPIQTIVVGTGTVQFDVYQQDLSRLGTTGDVQPVLSVGTADEWRTLPFVSPGVTTGSGVYLTGWSLISGDSIKLVFCNTSSGAELPAWLLNPTYQRTCMRIEGTAQPGATLDLTGALNYIDSIIGIY